MSFTNTELIKFCDKAVNEGNWIYLMGTIGQTLSQALLTERKRTNPHGWYTTSKVAAIQKLVDTKKKYRCVDCIGMIKCYYWNDYGTGNASGYKAESDWSADYMWNHATERGPLATLPELPGVAVWMSGHIGVYMGNGLVVESTPNTKFSTYAHGLGGPCYTKLSDRQWYGWLKIPFIEYENILTGMAQDDQRDWGKGISMDKKDCCKKGLWMKAADGLRWWYKMDDDNYPANGWLQDPISEKYYYFDENGYMMTGWKKIDGKWYFFEQSASDEGAMYHDQFVISPGDKRLYYLKKDGVMASGEEVEIKVPESGILY